MANAGLLDANEKENYKNNKIKLSKKITKFELIKNVFKIC